jgi:serine/threonine-protein kinase RsbW
MHPRSLSTRTPPSTVPTIGDARALTFPEARVSDLATVRSFVQEHARRAGLDDEQVDDLIQAVDEMATNVLVHGYGKQPGPLEVEVERDGDALVVRVRDEAPAFDPRAQPAPDLDRPLTARAPGGFGIHLTRGSVDGMHHRARTDRGVGNELTLVKRGRGGGGEP